MECQRTGFQANCLALLQDHCKIDCSKNLNLLRVCEHVDTGHDPVGNQGLYCIFRT